METYAAEARDHARLRTRVARVENLLGKTAVLRAARKVAGRVVAGRRG
jgi:hypothetical protein